MTRETSSFRVFNAFLSAFEMLLCGGKRALCRIEAVAVLMESLVSSGRRTIAASTSATISLVGIFPGVGET